MEADTGKMEKLSSAGLAIKARTELGTAQPQLVLTLIILWMQTNHSCNMDINYLVMTSENMAILITCTVPAGTGLVDKALCREHVSASIVRDTNLSTSSHLHYFQGNS